MARARLAELHGVATSYEPSPGRRVRVSEDTIVEVLAALGVDASTPRSVRAALDDHALAERGRLLPATVVLRAPADTAPGPTPAPRPATARPRPRRTPPLPVLPEGTALSVETESGERLPWDGAAFFHGRARDRAHDGAHESDAAETTADAGGLPLGSHVLRAHAPDGRSARATLLVTPERMPEPAGRSHGFLVQLYSLLSARSWGMGDLGDLAELASWSGRSFGCGFVQVNPLHAAVPGAPTDPSPYRPSSRRFPDPVYLRVEAVPEYAHLAGQAREDAAALVARATVLRSAVLDGSGLIDRDAVWALKREALELVRAVPLSPGRRAAYCDFLAEQGRALDDHATWCALAEVYGPDWHAWPEGLRDPRSTRTARARGELLDRVDFYCRLAWLTDQQLAAAQRAARDAGMPLGLVHDLAVGVHPGGADAWAQQDAFASGMSIGAPPDAFNARGQDWGLPPWRPDALDAVGYAPYRGLLRGMLRHAGALRIDHVMGLFRLWWVPAGRDPTQGAYVRYDAEAMLGVLALEAHRAGAVVIGEDLGTVEPGVRRTLAERGALGTSVLWFERDYASEAEDGAVSEAEEGAAPGSGGGAEGGGEGGGEGAGAVAVDSGSADTASAAGARGRPRPLPPEAWRSGCLATATTHDLPSTAARLTGEHVELRHRLGLLTRPLAQERGQDAIEVAEWMALLGQLGLLPEGPGNEEAAIKAVHRFLLRTPARLVGVWLPDAVGDRRPQNLPGTWRQYPNWRLPIADARGRPVSFEELAASPRLHALMSEVRGPARRGGR
ncbi:4-alpha-glucanotransferase, partial [Streptomyces varsoviensis]